MPIGNQRAQAPLYATLIKLNPSAITVIFIFMLFLSYIQITCNNLHFVVFSILAGAHFLIGSIFVAWAWSCYKAAVHVLSGKHRNNTTITFIIAIVMLFLFEITTVYISYGGSEQLNVARFFWPIAVLSLLVVNTYGFWKAASAIVAAEGTETVQRHSTLGTFVFFLYFPIGVHALYPRLRAIANRLETKRTREELGLR